MIRSKWQYPCVTNPATGRCDYKSARVEIDFGILKNGGVAQVMVVKASDYEIYDDTR